MKRQILISLILLCSLITINAQWNGESPVWTNSNVGIGLVNPNPLVKLTVQGEIHINKDVPYVQFNSSLWNAGSYIQTGVTTTSQPNGDFMVFYNPTLKGFNFSQGSYDALTIHPNGKIGIGITNPQTMLNVNIGTGGSNGIAGIRVGGLNNYESLELGIDGDYDGMIRSYGNNLNYYAGHWKVKGTTASENHSHNWYTSKAGSSDWSIVKMILNQDGNLGIGIADPGNYKLNVWGRVRAHEIVVNTNGADFVFRSSYKLLSLTELDEYIQKNSHLPDLKSASEMQCEGIGISEMQTKLLQKIEELTLYTIEQNKKIIELEKQNQSIEELKRMVKLQSEKIEKIEAASK
jgi:hypothetical protein